MHTYIQYIYYVYRQAERRSQTCLTAQLVGSRIKEAFCVTPGGGGEEEEEEGSGFNQLNWLDA